MRHLWLLVLLVSSATSAAAQAWNSDSTLALVGRAVQRRRRSAADTTLRDYTALAHGFLFFLGQFGEGLTEPPRLIKADQLELEVYWKAPSLSKQRIIGWRDRADLPTDINYHRDHLGIIQNNFGDAIRLGEGDEVRDVPHPLSSVGLALYDFALGDTTEITFPDHTVRVVEVRVRPKNFDAPRIVGTLYLDAGTADLVRMTFNFTPKAYLDRELEDVSIVLDNALWQDRFWLPFRQEIEIRRRGTFLDLPARGIIRGRWEIDSYQMNVGLVNSFFTGAEISPEPDSIRAQYPWREPLATAIQAIAGPVRESDLEAVRADVERIAGRHALSGLKTSSLGVPALSDLLHVNRVEGLTPGAGVVLRARADRVLVRLLGSYGTADRTAKGSAAVEVSGGRGTLALRAYREVRDVGDTPIISPLINSLGAQEFGDDDGDYYRADGARVSYRHGIGARGEWTAEAGRETPVGMAVRAAPSSGVYRPNPALGAPSVDIVRFEARRKSEGFAVRHDVEITLSMEGGLVDGGAGYARVAGGGHVLFPLGATHVLFRGSGGVASLDVPAYRSFVLGGRGTLVGEPFRAFGGRREALLSAEWRVNAPFFRIGAGAYARTPGTIVVAPMVAAGWSDEPVAGTPWRATPGARVTTGVAFEWLGVLRLEVGYGLQSRRAGVTLDVTRDFWAIL
ncbi:MAG TPA: hypothetical protein VFK78_10935 [Gemmatimonadales bacterium]|nr:hypothetical protein [Gemmatimonadales bacterium]